MSKGTVNIYKKDIERIKVQESELSFTEKKELPCFCFWANKTKVAIAFEYIKDEKMYTIEIAKNKIFSTTSFKQDELPTNIGLPIYINPKGELTGKKKSDEIEVGIFMGIKNNVALFTLI